MRITVELCVFVMERQRLCVQVRGFFWTVRKKAYECVFWKSKAFSWLESRPRSAPQCPYSVTESASLSFFFKCVYPESRIFPLLFAPIHKPQRFQKAQNSLAQLISRKPHLKNKPAAPPTHKIAQRGRGNEKLKGQTNRQVMKKTSFLIKTFKQIHKYGTKTQNVKLSSLSQRLINWPNYFALNLKIFHFCEG